MIHISYLSDLLPGEAAFIYSISACPLRERLYDLGFTASGRVECVAKAPLGGPCAYLIRGAVIALRREDARFVKVQRIPASSGGKHYVSS